MFFLRAARSSLSLFSNPSLRPNLRSPLVASALRGPSPLRPLCAEPGFLDKGDVETRVIEVVKKFEKVQPEKVSPSSHFANDLGLDSLDTVELVMALEDEFAIEIPDNEAEKIESCGDAVEYLANNVHAK